MNISCDMALDLITLYKDGVASEDSKKAIREHLKGCPDCARLYRNYSAALSARSAKKCAVPNGEANEKYTHLAQDLRKRRIVNTVSMVSAVALSVGVGAFCLLKMLAISKKGSETGTFF